MVIKEIVYGRGVGSSKKVAKSEAAKKTIEILIPELANQLATHHKEQKTTDLTVNR